MIFVPVSPKQTAVCQASREPLFITKNGYGDLVVMSIDEEHRTVVICSRVLFCQSILIAVDLHAAGSRRLQGQRGTTAKKSQASGNYPEA